MSNPNDDDAWLLLGANAAAERELGEVELGPYVLQRVAANDPALHGAVDPRWGMSEVLLLRARTSPAPWERRTAAEFVKLVEEDVGSPARRLRLVGEPLTVASVYVAPSRTLDTASWEAWLKAVRNDQGQIVDPNLFAALRREHHLDDNDDEDEDEDDEELAAAEAPVLMLARVRAKEEDLEHLVHTVRELLQAELPPEYLAFMREVGALRVELVEDGARHSLGTVLLPAKAVVQALDGALVRSLRENNGGDYVPFFQSGSDTYVFNMAADPATVARLSGEETHPSFAAWLAAWRDAHLSASRLKAQPIEAPSLATRAALLRCWGRTAGWVRPMYA